MKIKDVHVGHHYTLSIGKRSRKGCSEVFFDIFKDKDVLVLNKLNNFNNKNTINIQGICERNGTYELVSFWCSPYDLKAIKEIK